MIIMFLISLLISIIIHELSHFIMAKKVNCKIEEVSIGFGKVLYQFEYKHIIYKIKVLFFGGDCQLKGERVYIPIDKDAFCNLSYRKKVYIGLAGCFTNIVFGIISLSIGLFLNHFNFICFGMINLSLGIFNLLPIPCLDGSYLISIWLVKFLGEEKGYNLFVKINKIALKIWIFFNIITIILSIPTFIFLFVQGRI